MWLGSPLPALHVYFRFLDGVMFSYSYHEPHHSGVSIYTAYQQHCSVVHRLMPLLRGNGCVLFYRGRPAPTLDESFVQGVPGAECAMHQCFVSQVGGVRDFHAAVSWSPSVDDEVSITCSHYFVRGAGEVL